MIAHIPCHSYRLRLTYTNRSKDVERRAEDEMDVDEEGEDEDASMDEDAEGGTPRPKKGPKGERKVKSKGRKSEMDIAALTNEQAALAALESNQILHLRLRKRYYAEGLNFIRQIENAMEMLSQLLGSTNKAEVLEAMEFFRVAYEYQFDSAEVLCFCFCRVVQRSRTGNYRRLGSRRCFI